METATFIPPSLCGCAIRMTAEFTAGSVIDGITYRHPRPWSIKRSWFGSSLKIIQTCEEHADFTLDMPDVSRFYDKQWLESDGPNMGPRWHPCHVPPPDNCLPLKNALIEQHRGYIRYPIKRPSPAECLYTHLSMHRGQVHSYSCGCASFMHFDADNHVQVREPVFTYLKHPRFSNQCHEHQGDTVDMKWARADHEARGFVLTLGIGIQSHEYFEVIAA